MGRVTLYLMDSDIDKNIEEYRKITKNSIWRRSGNAYMSRNSFGNGRN